MFASSSISTFFFLSKHSSQFTNFEIHKSNKFKTINKTSTIQITFFYCIFKKTARPNNITKGKIIIEKGQTNAT